MASPADALLIARVKAGDTTAFEGLVTRYKGLVFSAVTRILADKDAAGDVMQEAFIKAYSALGKLEDTGAFKPWLLRIAANEAFRYLKERRPELLADEPPAAQQPWAPPGGSPEETLGRKLTVANVERAIAKLPPTYRAALILRFYGHLAYKEIADSLGITLANVKFRIHHGGRMLRAVLGREDE
ncbi:MAG: sigma-70 family RNA polymerase sigma factor [Candidatus Wallbacteria bacterium]|nr:sigma-70 family RNA polymerase sigma factor [Candidatus Wallbacteria bacterium]